MVNHVDLIRNNTLLTSLPLEVIDTNLRDGSFRLCSYGKNNIMHFSGEVCGKLEIILSGKVIVERIDESGDIMTIAEFFSDEILGGNLLFSRNPHYPLTITAKQPTIIVEIGKERLFHLFSENQEFLKRYLEFVSDHATILGDKIKHYINKSIRESIMSYLDYERKQQNSNHIILSVTKKDLAEKMGVQRTSLSRELAKMRYDGLIKYDAKSIEVLYR